MDDIIAVLENELGDLVPLEGPSEAVGLAIGEDFDLPFVFVEVNEAEVSQILGDDVEDLEDVGVSSVEANDFAFLFDDLVEFMLGLNFINGESSGIDEEVHDFLFGLITSELEGLLLDEEDDVGEVLDIEPGEGVLVGVVLDPGYHEAHVVAVDLEGHLVIYWE